MKNNQLVYSIDLGQLAYKIYEELVDNNLIEGMEANLYNMDKTVLKIAILTLYDITCLNHEFNKIKFNICDLTGIKEPHIILNDDSFLKEVDQDEKDNYF